MAWEDGAAGVLHLPSGRLVRGRPVRSDPDEPPEVGLYLLGRQPDPVRRGWSWEWHWVPWPDFRRPRDPEAARVVIRELWRRASAERVEVACDGGRGRTGTVLACWAVLDGLDAAGAVAYVRERYHPAAVETPGQRRFVAELAEERR